MRLRRVVAQRVRAFREQRGLSQEEAADRAEVHPTYLSGIENGRRNPTVDVLERLAKALDVEPRELLSDN